jgi:hypothetical protein
LEADVVVEDDEEEEEGDDFLDFLDAGRFLLRFERELFVLERGAGAGAALAAAGAAGAPLELGACACDVKSTTSVLLICSEQKNKERGRRGRKDKKEKKKNRTMSKDVRAWWKKQRAAPSTLPSTFSRGGFYRNFC